jgi:hypothetical protein
MIFKNIFERISVEGKFVNIPEKLSNCSLFDEINDYAIIILLILCLSSLFYLITKIQFNEALVTLCGGFKRFIS